MHKSAVLSGILHAALLSTIVIGVSATVRPAPQQLVFGIEIAADPIDDSNAAAVPSPIQSPATSGEEVVISNTNLLNKELHNLQRLNRRRVELTLHVAYHTPAKVLATIQTLVKSVVEAQDKCKLVRCGISDLLAPTIEVQVQFDVQGQSWDRVFQARHEIAIALLDAFAKARIELAGPDGKSITPPAVLPPPGTAGAEPEAKSDGDGRMALKLPFQGKGN